ncbi:MAG: glycosyltransferase family 2 protein [Prevotella sp.]|nr:glycosyltransferase family 2 protein [Prevotella sp.]
MTTDSSQQPHANGLSIVLAVHDQAMETEQHLPRFLTMACDMDYEVIVVDDSSADDTPDILMRLKAEHPRLYTTFLPKSVVFNPSRMQLALAVGAKAAHYPYIVLADITRPPQSDAWLQELARETAAHPEAIMAYSSRKSDMPVRLKTCDTLEQAAPFIRKAERRSGQGHRGKWLKLRRGLYDAVAVRRERVHDAIRLFDQRIGFLRLWGLRLRVYTS